MSNILVGDVYAKIIDEVVSASTTDFEETGVGQGTLQALQQEWQAKLSQRGVARMPWDPKPVAPTPPAASTVPSASANGLPSSSYTPYDAQAANVATNGSRIKAEPGTEPQYNGAPNGFPHNAIQPQGGIARAQQLVQQQYGQAASASLNAMNRGGLALPGQQQQTQPQSKPHALHLPQATQQGQQQLSPQQQQAFHQQHFQRQPIQPHIKVEDESPQLGQGQFTSSSQPNYGQTDGADEALGQWRAMLAQRRATAEEQIQYSDGMMRQQISDLSADLQSGLMLPLDELPTVRSRKRKAKSVNAANTSSTATVLEIAQLDGGDEDEDKADVKDEDDDENAINSDLDDSDDEGKGAMGDDDEEFSDEILCTYDKVQRVKNKWKCTLKDGIMIANKEDWVFHKATGEFEW